MDINFRMGDLVCLKSKNDSIGYIVSPDGKARGGIYVCIRWLEGEYKGQGWISIEPEILSLITDKEIIEKFNTNYPFEDNNSFKGTINLLNNDLFNKQSK